MRAKHWMPDRLIRSTALSAEKALDTRHRAGRTTVDTRHQQPGNSRTPDHLTSPLAAPTIGLRDSNCLRVDLQRPGVQASAHRDPVVQRTCHVDANPDQAVDVSDQASTSTPAALTCSSGLRRAGQDLAERDEEVRQLNLQYRNRLGMRSGGLHRRPGRWARGARRQRGPPRLPVAGCLGRSVRTRCCPWTVAEGLRSGLASFVAGYGSWFQGQAYRGRAAEHLHHDRRRLAHVAAERRCALPVREPGDARYRKSLSGCSEHCFHDQEQRALLRHNASPTGAACGPNIVSQAYSSTDIVMSAPDYSNHRYTGGLVLRHRSMAITYRGFLPTSMSSKRHTTVCDPQFHIRSSAFSNYPLLYTIYVESCLTTLMGRSHDVLENAKPSRSAAARTTSPK